MSTIPTRPVGVQKKGSNATAEPLEKLQRAPTPFQMAHEAQEFVDRVCRIHGSKVVATAVDRGYSAVRGWTGNAEHIPLVKLPELLALADRDDPFLDRFMASMGYRLLPLSPTPEQIIAALEEANVLKRGQTKTARRVVRGLRRDDRQPALWGAE